MTCRKLKKLLGESSVIAAIICPLIFYYVSMIAKQNLSVDVYLTFSDTSSVLIRHDC